MGFNDLQISVQLLTSNLKGTLFSEIMFLSHHLKKWTLKIIASVENLLVAYIGRAPICCTHRFFGRMVYIPLIFIIYIQKSLYFQVCVAFPTVYAPKVLKSKPDR